MTPADRVRPACYTGTDPRKVAFAEPFLVAIDRRPIGSKVPVTERWIVGTDGDSMVMVRASGEADMRSPVSAFDIEALVATRGLGDAQRVDASTFAAWVGVDGERAGRIGAALVDRAVLRRVLPALAGICPDPVNVSSRGQRDPVHIWAADWAVIVMPVVGDWAHAPVLGADDRFASLADREREDDARHGRVNNRT